MDDRQLLVDNRSVCVREAGDPAGKPVVYFHGTPGSRLDLDFGDRVAQQLGIRVISFDRPGYGRSDPAPFRLSTVARDAEAIADSLGLDRFAALGWSGGGPFALAAAAVTAERVTAVGVASGPGPFQHVPGALAQLEESDRAALALLPEHPDEAAQRFGAGAELLVAFKDDEQTFMSGMEALFGEADADVLTDPRLRHHLFVMLREGLQQGAAGGGWDNVAYVGPWDIDLRTVRCPVHLWYGGQDSMIPLAHGRWLAQHLPDARLDVRDGDGHLGLMRDLGPMLATLAISAAG